MSTVPILSAINKSLWPKRRKRIMFVAAQQNAVPTSEIAMYPRITLLRQNGLLVSKLSVRNCLKQFLPKSTVKQISRRWFVFSFDKSKCQNNWLFLSSFDKIVLVKEVSNILNAVTIRNRKETVNHALQVFKKRNLVDGSFDHFSPANSF